MHRPSHSRLPDTAPPLVVSRGAAPAGPRSAELECRLGNLKFGVGVGNFYAYRLLKALGIDTDDGALRVSFVHYTAKEEVERLIGSLDTLL